jgi:hypothetical protein
MKAKVNRENITRHLIEYQLEMVGKTMLDTLYDDQWYFNITMTSEQYEQFRKYSLSLLKKIFKFNNSRAISTFEWFNMAYGLRIKN